MFPLPQPSCSQSSVHQSGSEEGQCCSPASSPVHNGNAQVESDKTPLSCGEELFTSLAPISVISNNPTTSNKPEG